MKHSRAHIRQQRIKHIDRKRRLLHQQTFIMGYSPWEEKAVRQKDRKPCSCWACGNPRKHFKAGDPLQARRADAAIQEA